MKNSHIKTNSFKAWLKAARPKTLTGAAVPIMIGTALALKDERSQSFQPTAAVLCLLFAFIMQIDANFINDYFDFKHGNDKENRLGPLRACSEGWITPESMKYGIGITTLLASFIGLPLVYFGGWQMIIVGLLCTIFCFLYTTTLSYMGLGDVLVLVFFGIVPICVTFYVELHATTPITLQVFLMSLACGFVIDTLLLINNFRDRDNDIASGKYTLITKVGPTTGLLFYLLAGYIGISLAITSCIYSTDSLQKIIPSLLLITFPYSISHTLTYMKMKKIWEGKELNIILGETARNMFIFGLTTSLAILIL